MTKEEKELILNYEKEIWDEANYYVQEANNRNMSNTYRRTSRRLAENFKSKWCAIRELIEKLGIEDR